MDDLGRLVGAVERDDFRARLVAGSRIALECHRPEVAQVAARIVNRKSLVDGVDDPVRLQNLDPPLVGVDAMLGDDRRPAGLDRRPRRQQAGIAGRNRMVHAGRRQRKRKRRHQPAEQRAPSPEEVEERLVRHLPIVEIADQAPRQRRVEQVSRASCLDERCKKPDDFRQLGQAAGAEKCVDHPIELDLVERAWPAPTAMAVRFAQIDMMQRLEIGQFAIFRDRRRRLRENRDDAEPQIALATDQAVHPCRHASGDIRVGSFHDQADVGAALCSACGQRQRGSLARGRNSHAATRVRIRFNAHLVPMAGAARHRAGRDRGRARLGPAARWRLRLRPRGPCRWTTTGSSR